jgi:S-adenosylmethionine decarboxylase
LFFEGTEKKVEIAVDPSLPSLRGRGRAAWERTAERAGARVLSHIANDACDAYLLSESSLFVFDHKMIMITCGRTRLPEAVFALTDELPRDALRFLIYERKNEVFPREQPTSFLEDARALRGRFDGRALQFGEEDGHYLYLFHLDRPHDPEPDDVTVEVLMYGLDEEVRQRFSATPGGGASGLRRATGVDRILDGFEIDDYVFEPSGYSLNAIRGGAYWTVHVTPQRLRPYASFETNHREDGGVAALIPRVLEVFRPRSFDVVLWHPREETLPGWVDYRLRGHVATRVRCGYHVQFLSYHQPHQATEAPIDLPLE